MSETFLLFFGVLLISLICVCGGLYALVKQQVVVDREGNPSEIDIPLIGKLKTNYPSLVAILIGAVLALTVNSKLQMEIVAKSLPLVAELTTTDIPSWSPVIIAAFPQKYTLSSIKPASNEPSTLELNVDEPGPYTVVALAVSGVDEQNRPQYSVTQGPAFLDSSTQKLRFSGHLVGVRRALPDAHD